MYRIEPVNSLPDYVTGDFNTTPDNWRPIDIEEYYLKNVNTPDFIEKRQLRQLNEKSLKKTINAVLHWFSDGTGTALELDMINKQVNFYAFGCDHEWIELSQDECKQKNIPHLGSFYHHVEICTKCGNTKAYDTYDY